MSTCTIALARRHAPPFVPTLLAVVITSLVALPSLAEDFDTPQSFSPWENNTSELHDAHFDVNASQSAITVNDMEFSMDGGWVHNTGAGGGLLFNLWSGKQDQVDHVEIDSAGSFGLQVNGGKVSIVDSQVSTHGDNDAGLDAQSGGQVELVGGSVATDGDNSAAVHAHNNGGAQVNGSALTTAGDHAAGVLLDNNGTLLLDASQISTSGDDSSAIQANNGASLQVSGATLETAGQGSHGVHISSNGADNTLADSSITTHGAGSIGVMVNNASGSAQLQNSRIVTEGEGSHGLYTRQGTHIDLTQGSQVETSGANADGAWTAEGGSIAIADSSLASTGAGSAAVHAAASGTIKVEASQLSSGGSAGASVHLDNGGAVTASNSRIDSQNGSAILFSQGELQGGGEAHMDLSASRVTSDAAVVTAQAGSSGTFNATGSQLQAGNGVGYAIAEGANLQSTLTDSSLDVGDAGLLAEVAGNGSLRLTSEGSDLHGDTRLQDSDQGLLDMTLHNARWQMNADSTLSNLDVDGATVAFGVNGYHTLSMAGDLTGSGTFDMNTDLSSLQTDLILVGGQAYGAHTLVVADSGKEAGGDQLRVVGTQGSPGAFSLYGEHVDAGAYRYTLEQQGNDWYLVASGKNVVDPGDPTDPEDPDQPSTGTGDGGDPGTTTPDPGDGGNENGNQGGTDGGEQGGSSGGDQGGTDGGSQGGSDGGNQGSNGGGSTSQPDIISKGSNVALGMQSAAANLYYAELGTLVQRLGELRLSQDEGGVWIRGIGKRMRMGEHYGRAFDQNLDGVEIGADKAIHLDGARLYLGAMVGASESRIRFTENSRGHLDSTSVGAYATYLRDDGWYLDNVIKYSHMDGDVKVPTNLGQPVKGDYKADAYGVSVEGGKRIDLQDQWFVEPQVQLSATHFEGPRYTSSDGLKVRASDTDSLQGRIGLRGGKEIQLDRDMRLQTYATASYIDELAGNTHVRINGEKLNNQLPGSRGELGAGAALQVSRQQKVSLEVDYAKGDHLEQPWAVTLGYRYLW
ncbi:autotransporter outer membrane beta-barrel domain-containing protein [Pseudomonas sp. NY15435]|uniref:autotransporter family protein n=1 Tax=Pseudomonas sp. NY15435 TaxID=3400358 RepID=UPI003A85B1B2